MNPAQKIGVETPDPFTIISKPIGDQWQQNSSKRLNIIEKYNKNIYNYLIDLKLNKKTQQLIDIRPEFIPQPSNSNICVNNFNYYYVCRTCRQSQYIRICQQCFNKDLHKDHNYYTVLANDQCQCGIADIMQNVCSKHKHVQSYCQITKPEDNQMYMVFLVQFLNTFISKDAEKRKQYSSQFHKYLAMIVSLNQKSQRYNHATAYCLSLRIGGFPFFTILRSLIQSSRFFVPLDLSQQKIYKYVCGYHPFQFFLLRSISDLAFISNRIILKKIVNKLLRSPAILGGLARKDIVVFTLAIPSITTTYIDQLRLLMSNHKSDYKLSQYIIPITKLIFNKQINRNILLQLKIENILREFIYRHISVEQGLLLQVIKSELKLKSFQPINNLQIDNQWYNMRVRVILYAVKGSLDSFPDFFKKMEINLVKKFVKNYFIHIFVVKYKCKFNILTATCLFKVAKQYNFVDELSNPQLSSFLSCLKFSKNLNIVLRNTIAYTHLIAQQLMKVAEFYHNQQQYDRNKKIILQWFGSFLFLKKQISHALMTRIKRTTDFPQAKHLITSQTDFIQSRMVYIYKGPQRKQTDFWKFQNIEQIINTQKIYQFYTPERRQMLETFFVENINQVKKDKIMSYSNQFKRYILKNAIILDKLLLEKNQNVRKYIQQLKALIQTPKNKRRIPNQQKKSFGQITMKQLQKENEININNVKVQQIKELKTNPEPQLQNKNQQIQPNLKVKQLSHAQQQKNRKRAIKMLKIKQKFSRKSIKYSQHLMQKQTKQQQVCLICRQAVSKNRQKSFLFYIASLRNDQISQIMYGSTGNQVMITSCFHPYHQKCLSQNNSQFSNCTLCKTVGNFIIPVLNNSPECQMFTRAWWDDFIEMTTFTPKQNNSYSYGYYSNYSANDLKSSPKQKQTKQTMEQFEDEQFKNFIIVYRCLVLRITSFLANTKWQDFHKKIIYFYDLLKFFYDRLTNNQKVKIKKEIQQYQNSLKSKKLTNFVLQLSTIGSNALCLRLQGEQQNQQLSEKIKSKCMDLIQKYPRKLIYNTLKNVQWLLNCSLNIDQAQNQSKGKKKQQQLKTSQLISYLLNISIPQTVQQLYGYRFKCEKCNKMQNWFCVFCKKNGCKRCMALVQHCKNQHNSNTILMISVHSGMLATVNSSTIIQVQLYYNEYFNYFNQNTPEGFSSYRCNNSRLGQALEGILKKYF